MAEAFPAGMAGFFPDAFPNALDDVLADVVVAFEADFAAELLAGESFPDEPWVDAGLVSAAGTPDAFRVPGLAADRLAGGVFLRAGAEGLV
ncbi:hypothetical protein [Methyloligella solikamskensis]|uniref:Uncharacterized protein n=1 Tax=Methyloligella solikamskensis TaxID=1177756 RepID=A0ABW3JEW7_9HYPH